MAKIKFGSQNERKFAKEFSSFINKIPGFSLERSHNFYDFTLYHLLIPIAVIEVVENIDPYRYGLDKESGRIFSRVRSFLKFSRSQNVKFFILTDTNSFLLWEYEKLIRKSFDNYESIFTYISNSLELKTAFNDGNNVKEVAEVIFSCLRNYNINSDRQISINIEDLLNGIHLQGDIASFTIRDPSDNNWQDLETRFFSELLGTSEVKSFYKYTTLPNAFITLDSKKIRLNGIVGMNDTTETHYADLYIGGVVSYQTLPQTDVDELNKKFIYSCSTSDDDLTMWRLYAEDCKGVSIKFSLLSEKSRSFLVKKVSYAKADGTHPQLDLIKNIMVNLEKIGIKLVLRRFSIWKHFFKPYQYSIEKEVRILHLAESNLNIHWCLTASHSILNPYVLLPLMEFPARLVEIKLGPKCPELTTNLKQLESFLRTNNSHLPNQILVEQSKISNYR